MIKTKLVYLEVVILILILLLTSCDNSETGENGPALAEKKDIQETVEISWIDFIVLNGITYEANGVYNPDELWVQTGAKQPKLSLSKEFGVIAFNVSDSVHESDYLIKDGDAAFLPIGTKIFELSGYSPTFRLAIPEGNLIKVYEATGNGNAETCKDLFDIEGRLSYITINSEEDGTTVFAKIEDTDDVNLLEKALLETPVEDMRSILETDEGVTKWQNARVGERYFLTFYLTDGTSFSKSYWIESGAFGSNITLSSVYKEQVREALQKSPYTLGNTLGRTEPLILTGEKFEVAITIEGELSDATTMTVTSHVTYLGKNPGTFEGGSTVTEIYLMNANNIENPEMSYESMAQSIDIQPGHVFTDTRTIPLDKTAKGLHTLLIRTSWMTVDGIYYEGVGYEARLAYEKKKQGQNITEDYESLLRSTFEVRIPIFI